MCLVQSQAASSEWAEHSTVAGQRLQKLNVLKVMQNKTHLSYSKVCSVSLLLQSPGKRD